MEQGGGALCEVSVNGNWLGVVYYHLYLRKQDLCTLCKYTNCTKKIHVVSSLISVPNVKFTCHPPKSATTQRGSNTNNYVIPLQSL